MTIEEFFHACENARLTTVFKVFSFGCTLYNQWHKIITVEV